MDQLSGFYERNPMQDTFKENAVGLYKAEIYLTMSFILNCQKQCLSLSSKDVSAAEQACLMRCADSYTFFDNANYELDSAAQIAAQQGKQKKGFIYYTRRIEDLTTLPS